ncbi:hypothetical protein DIPPA_03679 [Diplonema papillatum]|nr:hypothetical protein DIPPA_03679 [Diplonema papillatum]
MHRINAAARLSTVIRRRWCSEVFNHYKQQKVHPVGQKGDYLENPLEPAELERQQAAEHRWMQFAITIKKAREDGPAATLAVIADGHALSDELGLALRRPGYDASLHLEAAAIHEAAGDTEKACSAAEQAELALQADKDHAGTMQARYKKACLLVKLGRHAEAEPCFRSIVQWIFGDGRRGTPMQQEAAEKLRYPAQFGLASAICPLGKFEETHELLGECLPYFANETDIENTWRCLAVAEKCFIGMKDKSSTLRAVERQVNWAKRFKLDDRLAAAEERLAALKAAA